MIGATKTSGRGKRRWHANSLCLVALLLYALSFFLPTFDIVVEGKRSTSCGYDAFVIGLMSPFASPVFGGLRAFAPWLANPLLWTGALLFGEGDRSLILIGYSMWLSSMGIFTLAAAVGWCSSSTQR